MDPEKCCNSQKIKVRTPEEYEALMNRLKRIQGQIEGIKRMLENDAYCPDILVQSSAASAAMNSFSKALLTSHLKSCVIDQIRSGDNQVIEELVQVLGKLMK